MTGKNAHGSRHTPKQGKQAQMSKFQVKQTTGKVDFCSQNRLQGEKRKDLFLEETNSENLQDYEALNSFSNLNHEKQSSNHSIHQQ